MKQFCIDYRNGGMGNTVLSHILYASGKVDLDLDGFFPDTGSAHKISKINQTNLVAKHLREFPDPELTCIIELYCEGWYTCLQQKMSYSKWYHCEPEIHNIDSFFQVCPATDDKNSLWQQFYNNIRDPSWPNCDSYENLSLLPSHVRDEIKQLYQQPRTYKISNEINLLEFLSLTYYDLLNQKPQQVYDTSFWYSLKDYLNGSLSGLIDKVCTIFPAWHWDPLKSKEFHIKVLQSNKKYLDWLSLIQHITQNTLEGNQVQTNLNTWEKAVIIARICQIRGIDPKTIRWDCFLTQNNISLINFLKEDNYGKAI